MENKNDQNQSKVENQIEFEEIISEEDRKTNNLVQSYYRKNVSLEHLDESCVPVLYKESEAIDESKEFIDRIGFLNTILNSELFYALKQLKETDQQLLIMRYKLQLSYKDIGVVLFMTEESVRQRHNRILKKLRMLKI